MRFQPSSDFEKQLLAAAQPQIKRIQDQVNSKLRRKLSSIERTHAGRPKAEVLAALESAVRSVGARPDRQQLAKLAERISDQTPAGMTE